MPQPEFSTHELDAFGGHGIQVYLWTPATEPTAIIQVFHGLGEHSARYQRFARAANENGYLVCAHDHRGHGPDAEVPGFFAADLGWDVLVNDAHKVSDFLHERYPGIPVVLLGHSMGSYIAQSYAMRFGEDLAALVLSGSTWPSRVLMFIGRILARWERWRHGIHYRSPLLHKIGFEEFNNKFAPGRTELDWLSRDPDEVDKYIDDPLCGGPYTTGLWWDLLGGLKAISSIDALRSIPTSLPVLITGGADDPVGGAKGMLKLADAYRRSGHEKVDKAIYADGRHEMLNEINRDEFTADLLRWIENALSDYQA
jgi:alpha-beta hydrolase superfamily lysophospholipase